MFQYCPLLKSSSRLSGISNIAAAISSVPYENHLQVPQKYSQKEMSHLN